MGQGGAVSDDVFPDRNMSHRDKVAFMIEREGWAMDAVPADTAMDPPLPRYAYTIGFTDGGQPCAFLPVDAAGSVALFPALAEYRADAGQEPSDFEMVQFAWPDPAGALPWEPAFAPHLAPVQLLLGEPPAA